MSVIFNKHGEEFHVTQSDSEDYKRFNITSRGKLVGYVNCHFEDDVLHLDDLCIYDKAMRPPLFFVNLFFWILSFPPEKWRTTNHQRTGLGTAMLKFLADYARRKTMKRIEGEIMPHDFKNNPDLPEWYRRRGFTVVMAGGKEPWVAKVSFALYCEPQHSYHH